MIKLYHKNPREITRRQFEDLKNWLEELGDLSGLVHDLNSNEIVGGNQRSRIFDINQCEIVLIEEYQEPDEQGTIAHGYVIWEGKKYNYRQVKWTEKQCEQANIVANKGGGKFDSDILANEFDIADLLEWGFVEGELGLGDPTKDYFHMEPEIEIGAELLERHDYIVLYFDNEFDWQVACELLEVKKVYSDQVGKKTIRNKGLGRVVEGKKILELINDKH